MKRHADDTLVFTITAAASVNGCEMLDKHVWFPPPPHNIAAKSAAYSFKDGPGDVGK